MTEKRDRGGKGLLEPLRVVVASPGDVEAERNMLPGIIEELNTHIAADRGLVLQLARWETDAYPGFHLDGPQGLIDSVLQIEQCGLSIFRWSAEALPEDT